MHNSQLLLTNLFKNKKIKSVKCGIAAAVVFAAGFAAFQSFGAYGVQDNSLLMQNIEALAQGPDGGSDATQGSSGYICPEGTGRGVYTDCPTETKTVELYSLSGHCLREITN